MEKYGLSTCPICKKKFVPQAMHIYRIKDSFVCSYSCMRAYQKKMEERTGATKRMERIKRQLAGGLK